jgi:hypothetical protein
LKIQMKPVKQGFKLICDEDKIAEVTINQAREGEHLERQDMFSRVTRVYEDPTLRGLGIGDGKLRLQVEQNTRRLRRKEAYLTLSSITGIVDDEGSELFRAGDGTDGIWIKSAMTEDEFNLAWAMLPREVTEEIAEYVLDVNPDWDATRVGE